MHENRAFVASALLEVRPLAQLRDADHRIDPARAGNLLAQVADALGAVHERGVVHTDVNMVNILIAEEPLPEHAFITGFWSPPEINAAATIAGFELPTLAYTAPEYARGEQLDGRADVYSLGCVLFHLLTGQRPFKNSEGMKVLWDHLNTPMPSISELVHDVPAAYPRIVRTATEKDPAQRFQTAGDLAAALRAAHM
jgi:serine/threonine-protein kinase